jgi:hypothetical protein
MWDRPLLIERVFFIFTREQEFVIGLGGGLLLNERFCYQYRAVRIYSATRRKNINDTKREIPTYGTIGLGHCSDESCLGVR